MNEKNTVILHGLECYEKEGVVFLKLEDVARGLGLTRITSKGNELVRWERVQSYLEEIGYLDPCGKADFIPENAFYRLAMKVRGEYAEAFRARATDEIIPAVRRGDREAAAGAALSGPTGQLPQRGSLFGGARGKVPSGDRFDRTEPTGETARPTEDGPLDGGGGARAPRPTEDGLLGGDGGARAPRPTEVAQGDRGTGTALQVFQNPEFGTIRTTEVNGEPWFVGKDVAAALGYRNPQEAIRTHVDGEDKGVSEILTPGGKQKVPIINESGLYSLVLSSKLEGARKFKRWVTSEVLPTIRKTGGYSMAPKDYPAALRALAEAEEKRLALEETVEKQSRAIEQFQPVMKYVDAILSSPSTMTTSQIAADYDLSAYKLNKILKEEGVQHKVGDQWILYKRHMGRGYVKSETIPITHSDGTPGTVVHTKWTQKGRVMIHQLLSKRGIQAVVDRAS